MWIKPYQKIYVEQWANAYSMFNTVWTIRLCFIHIQRYAYMCAVSHVTLLYYIISANLGYFKDFQKLESKKCVYSQGF